MIRRKVLKEALVYSTKQAAAIGNLIKKKNLQSGVSSHCNTKGATPSHNLLPSTLYKDINPISKLIIILFCATNIQPLWLKTT